MLKSNIRLKTMKSDRDMMDTINKSVGNLGILRKKIKK